MNSNNLEIESWQGLFWYLERESGCFLVIKFEAKGVSINFKNRLIYLRVFSMHYLPWVLSFLLPLHH